LALADKIRIIYIAGVSYCGSTLLGFLIGSSRKVFNAGEITSLRRILSAKDETCTCGQIPYDCRVWKRILSKGHLPRAPAGSFRRLYISLLTASGLKIRSSSCGDEQRFLRSIIDSQVKDDITILDNSKSVWRLASLVACRDVDVKVVFMRRDIHGNVASFIRNGKGFIKGYLNYRIKNYLIRRFTEVNKVDSIRVNYRSLSCNSILCPAGILRISLYIE
jgi:hypothetical protein